MPNKKPNNTVPPYVSGREFNYFLHMLGRGIPAQIDETYLLSIGVSAGNTAPLLSALRWLRLIDTWGRPYPDVTLLSRLANLEQKAKAFEQLLRTISPYDKIMSSQGLKKLTISDAAAKFRDMNRVVEGTDTKCARFFFYMAQEAAIELGERVELPPDFRLITLMEQNGQDQNALFEDSNDTEGEEIGLDAEGLIDSISLSIKQDTQRLTPQLLQVAGELIADKSVSGEGRAAGNRLLGTVSEILKKNPQLVTNIDMLKELTSLRDILSGKIRP